MAGNTMKKTIIFYWTITGLLRGMLSGRHDPICTFDVQDAVDLFRKLEVLRSSYLCLFSVICEKWERS